uniref:Uncharacterized protein n=1 Tax=Oryzias latipes TaxID=8090 RepID=A0A3P9I7D0_ORYLA
MSGLPSKEQNCLGVWSPVLSPVPPAGRTTDTVKSTEGSPEQVSPLPARPSRKTPGLAGLPRPSHLFRTLGCRTSISLCGGGAHRTPSPHRDPPPQGSQSHPPTRPGPAGPLWGPPKPKSRRHRGTESASSSPSAALVGPNAGPRPRRAPPAKQPTTTQEFGASPHPVPRHGLGPTKGDPPLRSRQPTTHSTVGPGESKAGPLHPCPGERHPRAVGVHKECCYHGPTRLPHRWNLKKASSQEQGPEPTPQGHRHPQAQV